MQMLILTNSLMSMAHYTLAVALAAISCVGQACSDDVSGHIFATTHLPYARQLTALLSKPNRLQLRMTTTSAILMDRPRIDM